MIDRYLEVPGIIVSKKNFNIPKARNLADALADDSIQFAKFIECRVNEGTEIVVFEVEVEVPQLPKQCYK